MSEVVHLSITDLKKNSYDVDIDVNLTVGDLKAKMAKEHNIDDPRKIKLLYSSHILGDTQILKESFLEDVIAILTSGCVPNLFEGDELQQRREAMRAEATKRNIPQTPQNLFNLYVQLSRENLHIVFSMSPAGDALRNRIRMFPPLVNNTTIDWFNEWPSAALQSVAENIISPPQKDRRRLSELFLSHQHE